MIVFIHPQNEEEAFSNLDHDVKSKEEDGRTDLESSKELGSFWGCHSSWLRQMAEDWETGF